MDGGLPDGGVIALPPGNSDNARRRGFGATHVDLTCLGPPNSQAKILGCASRLSGHRALPPIEAAYVMRNAPAQN